MVESGPFIEYCCVGYVKCSAVLPIVLVVAATALIVGFLAGRLRTMIQLGIK